MEWGNKCFEGIYYTRFIVSWVNGTGEPVNGNYRKFRQWLRGLTINGKAIPEEVIDEIYFIGSNGKMELEDNARAFFKSEK